MRKNKLLWIVLFISLVIIIFRFIFTSSPINGGDYTPITNVVQALSANLFGWCGYRDLGFNCIAINLHYSFFWITIRFFSNLLHLPSILAERIFLWLPFFILSFISISILAKKVISNSQVKLLSPIVYVLNTYVLMVLGGGQISGIGLGYAFTPLVLLLWIQLLEKQKLVWSLLWSGSLTILVALDPRIGFIACAACLTYSILYFLYFRKFASLSLTPFLKVSIFLFFIPLLVTIGLHFYWILPTLIFRQNPLHELGPAYDTVGAVKFFSFATFENALGLLHPNWPENVFGLTHFMRTEFIVLPFLAFSSLLFIRKEKKEQFFIIFFAILALVGAFLAKGANDPFGNIYLWMFEKIPGFSLFRDSTKWYLLVTISYSMLIPFSVHSIYAWIVSKKILKKLSIGTFFIALVVVYLLFLIRPALFYQLSGIFYSHTIPQEYLNYQSFMQKDSSFFRTLWVPTSSRYGQFDFYHPTIDAGNFLNATESSILADFQKPNFEKIVEEASIRYIVVPDDVDKEIFIQDRLYNENLHKTAVASLAKISWLKEEKIGNIVIFSVRNPKPHFWLESSGIVEIFPIDPNTYQINLKNVKKGQKLIFAEAYNKNWVMILGDSKIYSQPFDKYFNSFQLPKSGTYVIKVRFTPQDFVEKGLWVSVIVLFGVVGFLAFYFFKWSPLFFRK